MRRNLQVFYAFFSAIILALGIPNEFYNFGSPFLGLFALVPLYLAISNAKTCRWAGFLTAIQIMTVHLASSFWLGYFKGFAIFTLGASTLAYGVWAFFVGQFLFLAFYYKAPDQTHQLREGAGLETAAILRRVLLFSSIWVVWEWTKSTGFLGYPWGTVLMTAWSWPLITQIVDITGTWGLSFLFVLFSAVFAEGILLLGRQKTFFSRQILAAHARLAAFTLSLFMLTAVYGIVQYSKPRIPIKNMDTVIVQQNTDSWQTEFEDIGIVVSQQLTEKALKDSSIHPDLVAWSESTIICPMPYALERYAVLPPEKPLFDFIAKANAPFLIGGPVEISRLKQQYSNSALFFNKDGSYRGSYGKIQLVPFAEGIPFSEEVWMQNLMQALAGFSQGWTAGTEYKTFEVALKNGDSVRISTPICFEDAFPSVCRELFKNGSEVLVNITNDSWSKTNSAEYQHFVIAAYRAIEMRTTLVRSTNSGYSVVVDPAGRVLDDLPLFAAEAKLVKVPVYERTMTLYTQYGDWLPKLLLCASIATIMAVRFKKTKKNTLENHNEQN